MDGHDIVGTVLAVKAGVDTIKSLCGLLPVRRRNGALIPIYRLVSARDRDLLGDGQVVSASAEVAS